MKLSSFILEDSILIDEPVENKEEAICRLLETFEPHMKPTARQAALERLLERERKISSYVDYGVAIPHTKVEGINRVLVGLLTSRRGFDAQESGSARLCAAALHDEAVDLGAADGGAVGLGLA